MRTATTSPVLTMVCGYSRWASAVLIPTRTAEDLDAAWWQHLSALGAVPRALVWDGEGAVGRWRARRPELTAVCQAFRGTLAAKVVICKPGDSESKGLVERFHDYLELVFLPGRVFPSPADFNNQLADWMVRANHRRHRVLGCRPADRVEADKAAMLGLPPVGPSVGWRHAMRLPRDHYVRLDGNDYSVRPSAVGRRIELTADLHRVRARCAGNLVADHTRIWSNHQNVSGADHIDAAKVLRRSRFGISGSGAHVDTEQCRLTDCDTLAGLDGPVARWSPRPPEPSGT